MKIVSIYQHLKPVKWYNDLYDKIIKDEVDWWRDDLNHLACNPKPEHLKELKELLIKKKPDITDQEVWDSSHALLTIGGIAMSQAIIKMKERKRRKIIKEWRDRDKAKDQRIADTKPLEGINCSKCGSVMSYQWSELYDKGTLKQPNEQVMFWYECPNKCKKKLIFENGEPWISKTDNKCPVCNGERNTTVTKDNSGAMYFIHECLKCKSRQVEKESD